jgi:hypothetical protein
MNMMTDLPDAPLVPIPGSETWADGYHLGTLIEARFPDVDGYDFGQAWGLAEGGPEGKEIKNVAMLQQGENDGPNWVWAVFFDEDDIWILSGGCDYTGWDCQAGADWTKVA